MENEITNTRLEEKEKKEVFWDKMMNGTMWLFAIGMAGLTIAALVY